MDIFFCLNHLMPKFVWTGQIFFFIHVLVNANIPTVTHMCGTGVLLCLSFQRTFKPMPTWVTSLNTRAGPFSIGGEREKKQVQGGGCLSRRVMLCWGGHVGTGMLRSTGSEECSRQRQQRFLKGGFPLLPPALRRVPWKTGPKVPEHLDNILAWTFYLHWF